MSGSNALAAAKRRRGGSVDNRGPPPPGSSPHGQPTQAPPQPINPMQLVMLNHQRLNNLQNDLPKAIENLGENFNALSSNCDFLHEQFTSLQEEFQTFKTSNKGFNNTSTLNTFDNEKLNKLNDDMVDAHKVVAKMQSFAMETNINLSKLRDEYNLYSSSVNKRLDELEKLMTSSQEQFNKYVHEMNNRIRLVENSAFSIKNYSVQVGETLERDETASE
jgi:prefoldin subunit 5